MIFLLRMISHVKHTDINKQKWDACIRNGWNGIIYAYSWYLDIVAPNWDALIEGDYETLMPLPKKRKYRITYLIQPLFTQQLGVFSYKPLSSKDIRPFFDMIYANFKFAHIHLNTKNILPTTPKAKIYSNITHHLDLSHSYNVLYQNYKTNTKRNLQKAQNNNITIQKGISTEGILAFKQNYQVVPLQKYHFKLLRNIINTTLEMNLGETYGIFGENEQLCAIGFFLKGDNFAISLLTNSSPEGKEKRAMFYLLDHYIKQHATQNMILDFEGSNIPGVARFFEGFGSRPVVYQSVRINNLPWYLKWSKK